MAENQSGRSWIRRAGSEFVDRAFLGNRGHDYKSGFWNAKGAKQGGMVGLAGMLNPIAGFLASKGMDAYNRRNPGEAAGGVANPYSSLSPSGQWGQSSSGLPAFETSYGVDLPNYGGTAPGALAGMVGGGQGASPYGPYQGGYQFAPRPQAPTTSGLPDVQTSYGVSLPNYGGQEQQPQQTQQPLYGAAGGGAGMGSTMGGARGAYSQGGHTGEAARGMFEGMDHASRFNTNFDWLQRDRNS